MSRPPSTTPSVPRLEETLRDLATVGTLIKDRGYRQVWRFSHNGKAYFLKFYPKGGTRDRWRRRFRGSPAMREFVRLQWLQKAGVPAPRAAAVLMGLRVQRSEVGGQKSDSAVSGHREVLVGDAVILEAIEDAVQLDQYLNGLALCGERPADYRMISAQVRSLVYLLGKANLGHNDLHLGNFLLSKGKVYLIDAYAVRTGGLKTNDILQLGHSVLRYANRTDLLRGWRDLSGGDRPPDRNAVSERHYADFVRRAKGGNRYFGTLVDEDWSGPAFKETKYPRRWSAVSAMTFTDAQWRDAWATLRKQVEADSLEVLKRSPSGDVLAGELSIGGQTIPVIVKHPRRKYWYRWVNEIGRGSRARRAWFTSWEMAARNVPVAWPLLLMERRKLGYVTDALIVFERLPGKTLHHAELDAIEPAARDMLFRRTGRVLRKIDSSGFAHLDGKSTNFIVRDDDKLGPRPVLIDMDGIRRRNWSVGAGIERLLRAMKRNPQYTVADSLALCQGYAPYAPLMQEELNDEMTNDETGKTNE